MKIETVSCTVTSNSTCYEISIYFMTAHPPFNTHSATLRILEQSTPAARQYDFWKTEDTHAHCVEDN